MPNEKTEFANQTRRYQQEGRSVLFIGMFHTHPDGSKYPSSVFGDMDVLSSRNNVRTKGGAPPMGFIIYGSGNSAKTRANRLLLPGIKEISASLRAGKNVVEVLR